MNIANVGSIDRILRLLVGAGLIAAPFFVSILAVPGVFGYVSIAAGVIFILTSVFSYCPIYGFFRLRTLPKSS